jgi:hypothetical protein
MIVRSIVRASARFSASHEYDTRKRLGTPMSYLPLATI